MKRSRLDMMICEQEGLQRLGRREIEEIQLQKLNHLLSREKQRGGFYRALPESLNSIADLSALPFTNERDLAESAAGLVLTSQGEVSRVISGATSGTTGMPKRVFYTKRDLENTISLYMAGLGELIFPNNKVLICFPFSGPNGLGELISEAVSRLGAIPLKAGTGLSFQIYKDILEKEEPECFVGMPVQLLSILRVCGKESLKRALISGDACPKSVISGSEEILGTALFPHYGSREMGMAGAITCPAHEGMHLRENHIIAEIVDPQGKVLPRGEWGELIITTVGMEALPLIRYRTGDFTRILPDECPCGSETIRLDHVIRKGDACRMYQLDDALFSIPEVVDFCIEESGQEMEVSVLTTEEVDLAGVEAAVFKVFPEKNIRACGREVRLSDHALYNGKRLILRKTC